MQLQLIPHLLPVRALRAGACLALFFSLTSALAFPGDDYRTELRSKDAAVRLTATRAILEAGGEMLPAVLRRLLRDDDWEIAILAARGLGECGEPADLRLLVKVAVGAPIRELRFAAAHSMVKLDAAAAGEELLSKLDAEPANVCEALTEVGALLPDMNVPAGLEPLLKSSSKGVREAAVGALLTLARKDPEPAMRSVLESGRLGVRTRGLELALRYPHGMLVRPLRQLLSQAAIDDVVLRRALPALLACIEVLESGAAETFEEVLKTLCNDELPEVACRAAALADLAVGKAFVAKLNLLQMTIDLRRHEDPVVRTAAAHLLRRLDWDTTKKTAFAMLNRERDDRVKLALLRSILAQQSVGSNEGMHWAIGQLKRGHGPELREAIAVEFGDKMFAEETAVAGALEELFADPEWTVAASAAVALGKTRNRWGVEQLVNMATTHKDWRMRGAAVVGIIKAARQTGMPALIAALGDADPAIVQTSLNYLESLRSGEPFGADQKSWTVWWNKSKKDVELYDLGGRSDREDRFGPEATSQVVFEGIDVVIMDGEDGALAKTFEREAVAFRTAKAGALKEASLNARGVLVINCEKQWSEDDLDRLRWFVKVGGLLSGSGGGNGETIQSVHPGVLGVLKTTELPAGTVVANVQTTPSSFTRGVFESGVVPVRHLEGSHLIEVLQPERVEVLIDSPDSAERWGGGNLSCWFRSGHGVVLDLASPLAAAEFPSAWRLKKPEQRMAYAVDHMGTSFQRIRETAKDKAWKSDREAAQFIVDDSVFLLLTNFVRARQFAGI